MDTAPSSTRPIVRRAREPLAAARMAVTRMATARMAAALLAAAVLLAPVASSASSFQGYGETGWDYDNKRDCCDDAVYFAQQHAIIACEDSGGQARVRSGMARGNCDWDAQGASYDRVYRCTAKTQIDCR